MRKLGLLLMVILAACQSTTAAPVDPRNAKYTIERREVTLSNGLFEEPAAPGSAARVTTRLQEKGAAGDVNADGKPDAVAVLTSSGGGSGTFYYLVALLGTGSGKGDATNAVPLGDRIGIDAVRIESGKIAVDVLERRAGEPFTAAPSVKVTRVFQVKDGALTEVK